MLHHAPLSYNFRAVCFTNRKSSQTIASKHVLSYHFCWLYTDDVAITFLSCFLFPLFARQWNSVTPLSCCKLYLSQQQFTYFSSLSPKDPLSSTFSGLKRSSTSSTFVYPFLNKSSVYQNVNTERTLAFSRGFSKFFCSFCSMLHALVIVWSVIMTDDVYQHSIESLDYFVYKLIYFHGYNLCV